MKARIWYSLREAASLLGRRRLGPRWRDSFFDETPDSRPVLKQVIRDLYAVIKSNAVTCLLDQGEHTPHKLTVEESHHFAFHIDLAKNYVQLGQTPGEVWDLKVNALELNEFIKLHITKFTESEKYDLCLGWLIEKMKHDSRQAKGAVFAEAVTSFAISKRSFDRAWSAAVQETNSDWGKPGRPKSAH